MTYIFTPITISAVFQFRSWYTYEYISTIPISLHHDPEVHNFPSYLLRRKFSIRIKLHVNFMVETERRPACLCKYHLPIKTENGT